MKNYNEFIAEASVEELFTEKLLDLRHLVAKDFLKVAKRNKFYLEPNLMIFSHEEGSVVASFFSIKNNDYKNKQNLIFLFINGNPESSVLRNGFYVIEGSLNSRGINANSLVLKDLEDNIVQKVVLTQQSAPEASNFKFSGKITDAHVNYTLGSSTTITVSGWVQIDSLHVKFEATYTI